MTDNTREGVQATALVFVPVALPLAEAEAAYIAVRTVLESAALTGTAPSPLTRDLAGAMMRLATAIDERTGTDA